MKPLSLVPRVPSPLLSTVQTTVKLIQQKEIELDALRLHLTTIIKESTTIDINDGHWQLDLDNGELSNVITEQ